MTLSDFSRPNLVLELKEARTRRLSRRKRTIHLQDHRAHSLLATIREASGHAANDRRVNRIEILVEVIRDHLGMIGNETIVPAMIARRDNATRQIARHSIKRLQNVQRANNRKQTLLLVGRLVNDPAARRSPNERSLALKMILEQAWREPSLRLCRNLNRC
jgi:hypothetical protein